MDKAASRIRLLMVILKKNHAHPLVLLKAVYRTAIVHDQAKITGWLR